MGGKDTCFFLVRSNQNSLKPELHAGVALGRKYKNWGVKRLIIQRKQFVRGETLEMVTYSVSKWTGSVSALQNDLREDFE